MVSTLRYPTRSNRKFNLKNNWIERLGKSWEWKFWIISDRRQCLLDSNKYNFGDGKILIKEEPSKITQIMSQWNSILSLNRFKFSSRSVLFFGFLSVFFVSIIENIRKSCPFGWIRTRQSFPDFHCSCPPTSAYSYENTFRIQKKQRYCPYHMEVKTDKKKFSGWKFQNVFDDVFVLYGWQTNLNETLSKITSSTDSSTKLFCHCKVQKGIIHTWMKWLRRQEIWNFANGAINRLQF